MKVSKGTLIRTLVLTLALINQVAVSQGHTTLQVDDATLTDFINNGFTVGAAIWTFWKNNSFTQKALAADEYKKTL